MAAPPETTEAPPPPEAREEANNNGVEVCLFDESVDGFSRTVRAISELADGEPEPDFPEVEIQRLASSITFLREWRHFSYEPKGVRFTNGTEPASSRDGMHNITLPQFSSASVPQIVKQEDQRDDTVSFDIILFAGGNVWAMDWCPRFCDKPSSSMNCEYLAVAAHPPGSSYHKLGMPLTGRGMIQVWCLLAPFEDAHCHRPIYACNSKRRGRPRKIPDGSNSIAIPSNPPKPTGRPRKRPIDDLEPVPKRPRGRPRKYPLTDAKLEDSPQNNESRDIILFDPLAASTVIPDGLPLDYVMSTMGPVKSTPKRGRGRPKKNPSDKLTGSSGTVLKEGVCAALSPTSAICIKPKRPRGRPRKYPVPSSNTSGPGIDTEIGKDATRQPVSFGCTLDHNACVESNANLSIVAVDAALPIVDKLTCPSGTGLKDVRTALSPTSAVCIKPKRPRGRPPKYPVPSNSASVSGVDIEIRKRATDQSVSFGLDHTGCAESNGNLNIVAVDETLPIVDELTGLPATVVQQTVHTETSLTTGIRNEPKRKRGRPPKYPVPSNGRSILGPEIDIGKDTTGQPVSFGCSLNLCSNASTAVDAASPFTSSCTQTLGNKSQCQRSVGQNNKRPDSDEPCPVVSGVELQSTCSREIVPIDPVVSSQNVLPSEQYNIVSGTSQGTVHKGALSDIHISPKSSTKRESNGRRGRGRAKLNLSSGRRGRERSHSAGTTCFVASGANSPNTAPVATSQVNFASLEKSDGEFVERNLGSVGSCGCDVEKCNAHLSVVTSDAVSPAHGLYNTNCKEESCTKRGDGSTKKPVSIEHRHFADCNGKEQKKGTTPKSSDPVALVENCMKESCPKKGGDQPNKIYASKESAGASVGGTQTTERFPASVTSRSEAMVDEAGLIGSKNGVVGRVGMIENKRNATDDTSHCNENAGGNQVAPSFHNTDKVIDEMGATKLVPLKESREDGNMFSCVDNSHSSPVPKEISLPRVVLCLAHNGKVAWDIKWKPPLLSQFEQKLRLGFLAVLLGNGSLEVWEVPSPSMIQKIYSPSKVKGSDPRFLKLEPVFRCVKVKCGNRQSIPLTVDWSPSPPHDMILAGCHDGTVALWNFSTDLSSQDSKPFMCVSAESVPIRALSWAPYISEGNTVTFVTAGEDGLKFWDLRDPYRPLWELTTAPRAVLSLHWLKDARGIIISLEDGTLKFLSLPRIANDVPVTGRPFVGTKTQGVSTYQLSEYLIWSVHASEATGCAAYCGADGTAVHFQLTSRFWDKEPGKNRAPYFLCGSLSEEGENIKIGGSLQTLPLPNVPLAAKKGPKSWQDIVQTQDVEKEKLQITDSGYDCTVNPEPGDDQEDEHSGEQETTAIVLASPTEQENDATLNSKDVEAHKDSKVIPPKSVALHRVRWNTNKGSERWLCYGGAAGIVRCQRI